MKQCSKCGEVKSIDLFYRTKKNRDGRAGACKKCNDSQPRNIDKRRKARSAYAKTIFGKMVTKAADCNTRARKLYGVFEKITPTQMKDLFDSHGWCCYYCDMQSVDPSVMTVDHVVPLSAGGDNTIQNCVPACSKCNKSKGASE